MKPKENVVFFNKELGINNLFEEIITVDVHGKKIKLIENFAQNNFIPEKNVYFVDDHPSHLEGMNKTKINCYLADWGYNLYKNTFDFNIDSKDTISINDFNDLIEKLEGEKMVPELNTSNNLNGKNISEENRVVGFGSINQAVVENLVNKKHNLVIFNRTYNKLKKVACLPNVTAFKDLNQVFSECTHLLLCLSDDNAVKSVLYSKEITN